MSVSIGIQLYTVRDACQKDFKGTLKVLAEIGYQGVEFAGVYGGMSPRELAKYLQSLGLQCAGMHTSLDEILKPRSDAYAYAGALNSSFVTTSLCNEVNKDWAGTVDRMLQAAAVAYSQGFLFTYHNHAGELAEVNGTIALDQAMARPSLLQFELDTYWVKKGGQDPAAYIRRYAGRAPQVHIKDMDKTDGSFAEVGYGTLDLPAILNAVENSRTRWLIVEQDTCKNPPLESAKMSFETLKKAGLGG
ncbi:MAG: sugar phosphate isomerase/epimerase [bacterium]